jgi:hypothetical protein
MNEKTRGNSFNAPCDYHVEISGWGLDNSFFVERTDLQWTAAGEKEVQLYCSLPEGAMVFVRLLAPASSMGSVPMTYRVRQVLPMDSQGRCQMSLQQLHPRSRESFSKRSASNCAEDSQTVCDATNCEAHLQLEEILQ